MLLDRPAKHVIVLLLSQLKDPARTSMSTPFIHMQKRHLSYGEHLTGSEQFDWVQALDSICLQLLKVETSPGLVETCQLNQVEQVASEESARLAAMHHVGPIHTFMFSQTGRLLMANKRGRERYIHLSNLLWQGTHAHQSLSQCTQCILECFTATKVQSAVFRVWLVCCIKTELTACPHAACGECNATHIWQGCA